MITQVAHRLPQVRLRGGAEDLRGGALRLGVRRAEQHPPAPDRVLGAAYLEANGDELSVESDGREVVDDRFVRIGCVVACRLSGHADPRAGLCKDIRVAHLRNTFRRVAGRRYPKKVNGAGANVAANNATATHHARTRERGKGRGVSSRGGCPRRPRDRSSTSPPQTYHPNHKLPSAMTTSQKASATRRCHRGSRAYRMCPPSSWPMGSRLSIVTNIPTQPANASGPTITAFAPSWNTWRATTVTGESPRIH